jgi:N-glycosylase/DNA lyase
MQLMLDKHQEIKSLAETVRKLEKDPRIKKMVDDRIDDFKWVHQQDSQKWYEELVYCILTAYSSAIMGQRCVDALCHNDILIEGSLNDIESCLFRQGHRFAKRRAEYIYKTRNIATSLKKIIEEFNDSKKARDWLVTNIKGLGYKEASHYLRNVGYFNLAIIDRHILSNMKEHGLIENEKKGLTKKRYLEYEKILNQVAKELDMHLGKLDLYLWYRKTGKVLK